MSVEDKLFLDVSTAVCHARNDYEDGYDFDDHVAAQVLPVVVAAIKAARAEALQQALAEIKRLMGT